MQFILLLVLALATPPAPSPSPQPSLDTLKVIGHVRSTPFCTALRENVGPAIGAVLQNDDLISSSKPVFATLYQDDVLTRSEGRAHFDVYRLEKLITPLAQNLKHVDALLAATGGDPKLKAMHDQLQSVAEQQKASLNVIGGFVATEQMGEIQLAGPPDNWAGVFSALPQSSATNRPAGPQAPVARTLFAAGVHARQNTAITNTRNTPPQYNARNVGPTYDPFGPLVTQIDQQRDAAQTAETQTAKLVTAALAECAP